MAKEKGICIKIEDLFLFQEKKGKSLIHRCCGKGMYIVQNMTVENNSKFYICSKDCGSIEIPYLAQLLGYDGENFYGHFKSA